MSTTVPITKFKDFTEVMVDAIRARKEVKIVEEAGGEPVAMIVPVKEKKKMGEEEMKEFLKRTFGSMPDFPDVVSMRRSKSREIAYEDISIASVASYTDAEKEDARAFWKRFHGIFPDFPDVTKDRHSRDRSHIKL